MLKKDLIVAIQKTSARSAWDRGILLYAVEIVEELEDIPENLSEAVLLRGAASWQQYSNGGFSLVYDGDIAARLYTSSELKLYDNGNKPPRKSTWIDAQANALSAASKLILATYRSLEYQKKTSYFSSEEK